MSDDKQINEWRQHRRRSVAMLPVEVGILVAVCVVLFIVSRFVAVPTWLSALLIGMAAFTVFGDAINIAYLSRKLRRAERERADAHTPSG
jgi:heme A synthase